MSGALQSLVPVTHRRRLIGLPRRSRALARRAMGLLALGAGVGALVPPVGRWAWPVTRLVAMDIGTLIRRPAPMLKAELAVEVELAATARESDELPRDCA